MATKILIPTPLRPFTDKKDAVDAEGATLADPDGPRARVRNGRASFPAAAGYHRLVDDAGATLALTR